jgi:hypothetical protein
VLAIIDLLTVTESDNGVYQIVVNDTVRGDVLVSSPIWFDYGEDFLRKACRGAFSSALDISEPKYLPPQRSVKKIYNHNDYTPKFIYLIGSRASAILHT